MAKLKGKGKIGRKLGFRHHVPQVNYHALKTRPGQKPQSSLVPMYPSTVGIARSPARATYKLAAAKRFPMNQPRNRQTFSPFTPPPGLRSRRV